VFNKSRDLTHLLITQVYPSPRGDGGEYGGRRRDLEEEERRAASRAASEIYASTRFPRPQSQMRCFGNYFFIDIAVFSIFVFFFICIGDYFLIDRRCIGEFF